MSSIDSLSGAGAHLPGTSRIDAYQSLSQLSENRRVSVDTQAPQQDLRQRMTSMLSAGEERTLIDKTKDIAANLFNSFKHELREALHQVGIRGESAADLVRDVGKAFSEAVRAGTSFSFSMIAAAYKETLVQTGTSVSHALEFSANALSIEYNHATGELTADTSKLEIDAVRVVRGDNLPAETNALFDFTDSEGAPTIATLFDRVQQYLASNGFIEESVEESVDPLAINLPSADEAVYDAILINDEENGDPDVAGDETEELTFVAPAADTRLSDAVRLRAVEEFSNARQETVTRMTLDLIVRVHMPKDEPDPEMVTAGHRTNETFEVTA